MMYSRQETITPEVAAAYLQKNVSNRPIQRMTVKNYARDMLNGKWELNEQGIGFYENGNLVNGQYRLSAVIEAGIPVEMYVTYNVPNNSFIHDRGRGRTMKNILDMNGFSASIASNALIGGVNFLFSLCGKGKVTDKTIIDFCNENEEILSKCVSIVCSGSHNAVICKKAPIIAATFCALYIGIKEDVLREFFTVANTGYYNEKRQTSAIVLRNFLFNDFKQIHTMKNRCFAVSTNAIKDFSAGIPRQKAYRQDIGYANFEQVKKVALDKYIESYTD